MLAARFKHFLDMPPMRYLRYWRLQLAAQRLKTTDTPWYYQSSLARMELKAGHNAAAIEWSAKARESAKGNASRLQWLVSDLLLNAQVDDATRPARVADLLARYYDLAFELPDGFSGRNAVRARTVVEKSSLWKWPPVLATIDRNRKRCAGIQAMPSNDCRFAFPAE